MSAENNISWYVARTIPVSRIEFSVLHAITQRERPAMVPFEEDWIVRRGRKTQVKVPFFPCYVFVGLRHQDEFHWLKAEVNDAAERSGKRPPLQCLIGYGRQPATLTQNQADFVRTFSRETPTEISLRKSFRQGSKIVVTDGPFRGFKGTVDSVTRKSVKAMLEIFGTMRPVEIENAGVEAA